MQPLPRSFLRMAIAARARPVEHGDPVHEYLIAQANLRGFRGAVTVTEGPGAIDPELSLEEIVVGLIQPHAPAEIRVIKLVVRMLQSKELDAERLVFFAKREKATAVLRWILEQIPEQERNEPIERLAAVLARHPVRGERKPRLRFDPERLRRKWSSR